MFVQRHIPQDSILQRQYCDNFRSPRYLYIRNVYSLCSELVNWYDGFVGSKHTFCITCYFMQMFMHGLNVGIQYEVCTQRRGWTHEILSHKDTLEMLSDKTHLDIICIQIICSSQQQQQNTGIGGRDPCLLNLELR